MRQSRVRASRRKSVLVPRDAKQYAYSPTTPAVEWVPSGSYATFETLDARGGAMSRYRVGSLVDLGPPPSAGGNPVTGPLGVTSSLPGDALVVDVHHVRCLSPGWVGAHGNQAVLPPDRVYPSRARICAVTARSIEFSEQVRIPLRPMVGCIGTAPAELASSTAAPGVHGGNIDQSIVTPGARVLLPIFVPGGLLSIGDVHASQGDGELSSAGIEVSADVTVQVRLARAAHLRWPWAMSKHRLAVLTSASTFEEARNVALREMVDLIVPQLGMEVPEALALLSAIGDLRIGQACGGMDITLRIEVPRSIGVHPLGVSKRKALSAR